MSFLYSYDLIRGAAIEGAKLWARASFEKDVIVRHWASLHGGVYVPVSEHTLPNQYLKDVPDREITTAVRSPPDLGQPCLYVAPDLRNICDSERNSGAYNQSEPHPPGKQC